MDITYHLTPNGVLLYFQDCFANYLKTQRIAAFDIIKDNLFWIISQFNMTFIGPRPIWSETISVEMWVRKISTVKLFVNFHIKNEASEIVAEGDSVWAVINTETKRPHNIAELLASRGITPDPTDIHKIHITAESEKILYKEVTHQVNMTDLDFNGHMCNRSYLNLAMGTAPIDFIRTYLPQKLSIQFKHEAFIGEELRCQVFQAKDTHQFFHSILNTEGVEICTIASEWQPNSNEEPDISTCVNRDDA